MTLFKVSSMVNFASSLTDEPVLFNRDKWLHSKSDRNYFLSDIKTMICFLYKIKKIPTLFGVFCLKFCF